MVASRPNTPASAISVNLLIVGFRWMGAYCMGADGPGADGPGADGGAAVAHG